MKKWVGWSERLVYKKNPRITEFFFIFSVYLEFYFRVVKTIFYERAQRVSKTSFLPVDKSKVLPFISPPTQHHLFLWRLASYFLCLYLSLRRSFQVVRTMTTEARAQGRQATRRESNTFSSLPFFQYISTYTYLACNSPFHSYLFSFALQCFWTWMRGNFGQFCSFCPKLPHIHVQIHYNANEKG